MPFVNNVASERATPPEIILRLVDESVVSSFRFVRKEVKLCELKVQVVNVSFVKSLLQRDLLFLVYVPKIEIKTL